MMSQPLVSVWCSTYNHEKYIAQTIEGFVMQKTNFEFEIFVHDDASNDNTAHIIHEYAAKYPQIKPIYQTKNQFSVDKNFLNRIMFEKTQGKYIAMCEGDDYWTDPLKLQKQVDFLEANSDFAISFHQVKVVHENTSKPSHISNQNQKEVSHFEDLTLENFIHTPSCVFRNVLKGNLPEWFAKVNLGDWCLFLLLAHYGKVKFFEEVMANYRVHEKGFYSLSSHRFKLISAIQIAEVGMKYFAPRGSTEFESRLVNDCSYLCFLDFNEGLYEEFREYYKKCRSLKSLKSRTFLSLTVRNYLSYFPFLSSAYKKILKKSK